MDVRCQKVANLDRREKLKLKIKSKNAFNRGCFLFWHPHLFARYPVPRCKIATHFSEINEKKI